jgi:hypothetical protein
MALRASRRSCPCLEDEGPAKTDRTEVKELDEGLVVVGYCSRQASYSHVGYCVPFLERIFVRPTASRKVATTV